MDKFTSKSVDDLLTISFMGEMDTLSCIEIEDKVKEIIGQHKKKVVFDLANVNYIASSFIRLCGTASDMVGSSNLVLINIQKDIKKIFVKIGLTNSLNIK